MSFFLTRSFLRLENEKHMWQFNSCVNTLEQKAAEQTLNVQLTKQTAFAGKERHRHVPTYAVFKFRSFQCKSNFFRSELRINVLNCVCTEGAAQLKSSLRRPVSVTLTLVLSSIRSVPTSLCRTFPWAVPPQPCMCSCSAR